MERSRERPERQLAHDGTGRHDLLGERAMLGRIDPIDAAGQHADRDALRLERPTMGLGIDPPREPRNDHEPGTGEIPRQAAREGSRLTGGRAGADDRDGLPAQNLGTPADGEDERRIVDRAQTLRVRRVRKGNDPRLQSFIAGDRGGQLVRARGVRSSSIAPLPEELGGSASRAKLRADAFGKEGELALERDPIPSGRREQPRSRVTLPIRAFACPLAGSLADPVARPRPGSGRPFAVEVRRSTPGTSRGRAIESDWEVDVRW